MIGGATPGKHSIYDTRVNDDAVTIEAYRIVKLKAGDKVEKCDQTTDEVPVGVSGAEAVVGASVSFCIFGDCEVMAGAAIAEGALIMADANGKAITFAGVVGKTVKSIGYAKAAATADGDIIPVFIYPPCRDVTTP